MKLALVHYHAEPGGVTTVLVQSALALLKHGGDVDDIQLVVGRDGGVRDARLRILEAAGLPSANPDVSVRIIPEMDYRADHGHFDHERRDLLFRTFREIGRERVLVLHNYHLGKNAEFTDAVLRLAEAGGHSGIVFYIHDFPEAGRPANHRYLERHVNRSWYPSGPGIRYAAINERDLGILRAAGIPADQSATLFNPMATEAWDAMSAEQHEEIRERLWNAARALGFRSTRKWLSVYPVRAIRRKNVLEAAMLTRFHPDGELWITLPGTSPAEERYSGMVTELYRDSVIRGAFPANAVLEAANVSFPQLLQASDLVVSSSVQEGFGLTFVEAIRAGRPLFARYLDVLGDPVRLFGRHPLVLWNRVMVPLWSPSLSDPRPYLRMRYLQQLEAQVGASSLAYQRLAKAVAGLLDGDAIDFSFLPPDMQQVYLRDLARDGRSRDGDWELDIASLNADAINAMLELPTRPVPDATERKMLLEDRFSHARYARDFSRLLVGIGGDPATGAANSAVVSDHFTDLGYHRLLMQS